MDQELLDILDKVQNKLTKLNTSSVQPSQNDLNLLQNILIQIQRIMITSPLKNININKKLTLNIDYEDLKTFFDLTFDYKEHAGYIDIDHDGYDKAIILRGEDNYAHTYMYTYDLEIHYHVHPHFTKTYTDSDDTNVIADLISIPSSEDLVKSVNHLFLSLTQIRLIFTPEGIYTFEPIDKYSIFSQKGKTLKEKIKNRKEFLKNERSKLTDLESSNRDPWGKKEPNLKVFENCVEELVDDFNKHYIKAINVLIDKHPKGWMEHVNFKASSMTRFDDDVYSFQSDNANLFVKKFKKCTDLYKKTYGIDFPYKLKYIHWRDVIDKGLQISNVLPFEQMAIPKLKLGKKEKKITGFS